MFLRPIAGAVAVASLLAACAVPKAPVPDPPTDVETPTAADTAASTPSPSDPPAQQPTEPIASLDSRESPAARDFTGELDSTREYRFRSAGSCENDLTVDLLIDEAEADSWSVCGSVDHDLVVLRVGELAAGPHTIALRAGELKPGQWMTAEVYAADQSAAPAARTDAIAFAQHDRANVTMTPTGPFTPVDTLLSVECAGPAGTLVAVVVEIDGAQLVRFEGDCEKHYVHSAASAEDLRGAKELRVRIEDPSEAQWVLAQVYPAD